MLCILWDGLALLQCCLGLTVSSVSPSPPPPPVSSLSASVLVSVIFRLSGVANSGSLVWGNFFSSFYSIIVAQSSLSFHDSFFLFLSLLTSLGKSVCMWVTSFVFESYNQCWGFVLHRISLHLPPLTAFCLLLHPSCFSSLSWSLNLSTLTSLDLFHCCCCVKSEPWSRKPPLLFIPPLNPHDTGNQEVEGVDERHREDPQGEMDRRENQED